MRDAGRYVHPRDQISLVQGIEVEMIRKSSQIEESRLGCNEVFLEGRVSNLAVEKQLPSGDTVVEFRIVIDRTSRRGSKREVDTLDVAAWLAGPRKKALSLKIDDWVSVEGAVRRRFWKAPNGLASRWQVEASQLRRI